jgi:hypothetical protein
VGCGVGEFVGLGLGSLMATGVDEGVAFAVGAEPQADARSAVTVSAWIQFGVFMSLAAITARRGIRYE